MKHLPAILLFSICVAGQSAKPATPKTSQSKPQVPLIQPRLTPDAGAVAGDTYTNKFFNFSYRVPQGWIVRNETTREGMLERGQRAISGDPDAQPEAGSILLFSAGDRDDAGPDSADVSVISADLAAAPEIQTAQQYLASLREDFAAKEVRPLGDATAVAFGGINFVRQRFVLKTPTPDGKQSSIYQTVYITLLKRHAVGFVFLAPSQEGVNKGEASMASFRMLPVAQSTKPVPR